jgi:hypothetical protein
MKAEGGVWEESAGHAWASLLLPSHPVARCRQQWQGDLPLQQGVSPWMSHGDAGTRAQAALSSNSTPHPQAVGCKVPMGTAQPVTPRFQTQDSHAPLTLLTSTECSVSTLVSLGAGVGLRVPQSWQVHDAPTHIHTLLPHPLNPYCLLSAHVRGLPRYRPPLFSPPPPYLVKDDQIFSPGRVVQAAR